jgi:hypothetical protein
MARSAVKSFLLVISAAFVVALAGLGSAAPASAAVPCWKALINDWFDGHIDHIYPVACYSQAINHLPHDVEAYSSAKDDIQRAMLDAIRQDRVGGGPVADTTSTNGGGGGGSSSSGGGSGSGSSSSGSGSEPSQKGLITRAIEWLGPSNAASVPLPLLILAGVAFLLLAAAGGSFISRRIQERRLPPPPET